MGFDEARLRAAHVAAHGAGETPVAPQRADVERVEHERLDQLQPRLRQRSRVQRNGDVALEQRLERALGDALRRSFGPVILADDRETHQGGFIRGRKVVSSPDGAACPAMGRVPGNDSKVRAAAALTGAARCDLQSGLTRPGGARAAGYFATRTTPWRRFRYNRSRVSRSASSRPRHADRRRQCRREGADPCGGAALHPALPRQDDHRQVRRQCDDRAAS